MQDEGIYPNAATYVSILKACGSIGFVEKGEEIHTTIRQLGLLEKDVVLGTALVDMYAKCGALAKAQKVFNDLPSKDVICWSALISGYVQHGDSYEALKCFKLMQDSGVAPDTVIFTSILKACSSIGSVEKGEKIHAEIRMHGLLGRNVVMNNALVDMYVKCGAIVKAQSVFDRLTVRDTVSWNVLIAGYAQHGFGNEALCCFRRMQEEGILPNPVTFASVLKACAGLGYLEMGEGIHVRIVNQGLVESDAMLATALVDMYAKCGALEEAQHVFDELPTQDVISWSALIGGYIQHGLSQEAIKCFEKMQEEGFSPNAVTFALILKAYANLGLSEKGEEIHSELSKQGLLYNNITLGNALVDMYAKCGKLAQAQRVFDQLSTQDIVSWTSLLLGYAQLGQTDMLLNSFIKMLDHDILPDVVTFVALLTASSHAGLIEEGELYFNMLSTVYNMTPVVEHFTCMVDIYSRAGCFDKALFVINLVPVSDRFPLWLTVLGACRKWVNIDLASLAFLNSIQLNDSYLPAYFCMSDILAAVSTPDVSNNDSNHGDVVYM